MKALSKTPAPAESAIAGAGLGLRRGIIDARMTDPPDDVDFMEIAPENWIRVGGKLGSDRYSLVQPQVPLRLFFTGM